MTARPREANAAADTSRRRWYWDALRRLFTARREPISGVNLIGYARGGLGLGEVLRSFCEAARRGGLPFSLIDFDVNLGERGRDTTFDAQIGTANPYPVNLFFVNADQMPYARDHFEGRFFAGRRNVGFWFWELEGFPREWHASLDLVDEVWVASRFVQSAIRSHTAKPVRRVTLPVEVAPARPFTRAEFGLPEDRFVFLTSFDFHSYVQRKNPQAVIAAFRAAFPRGDEPALLVLKSMNGARMPDSMAQIRQCAGGDGRVVFLDAFLDRDRTTGLTSVADCYVSLHRSEGFGLGMAEAMRLAKPVIATAYSGNLDFMNAGNSLLVPARLVPVGAGDYPFGKGQRWAEPDVGHAAGQMRMLVANPQRGSALGRAAEAHLARHYGYAAALESLRAALHAAS